jgi:hypothetical protein
MKRSCEDVLFNKIPQDETKKTKMSDALSVVSETETYDDEFVCILDMTKKERSKNNAMRKNFKLSFENYMKYLKIQEVCEKDKKFHCNNLSTSHTYCRSVLMSFLIDGIKKKKISKICCCFFRKDLKKYLNPSTSFMGATCLGNRILLLYFLDRIDMGKINSYVIKTDEEIETPAVSISYGTSDELTYDDLKDVVIHDTFPKYAFTLFS